MFASVVPVAESCLSLDALDGVTCGTGHIWWIAVSAVYGV